MFRINVAQNQWVIFACFGGIVVLLGVVLLYYMMWRPRKETGEEVTGFISFFRTIPLVVIVTIILLIIYQIAHVILYAKHPPNL